MVVIGSMKLEAMVFFPTHLPFPIPHSHIIKAERTLHYKMKLRLSISRSFFHIRNNTRPLAQLFTDVLAGWGPQNVSIVMHLSLRVAIV